MRTGLKEREKNMENRMRKREKEKVNNMRKSLSRVGEWMRHKVEIAATECTFAFFLFLFYFFGALAPSVRLVHAVLPVGL